MGNIDLPTTGWIRRVTATLLITAAGLLAGLFIAGPANAATAGDDASTAVSAQDTARAASAVGSGLAAEITATIVAGVLILGAAGGVIAYTARHRDEFHEPEPR